MEFKIGDRVKMIKPVDGFKADSIGTVRRVRSVGDYAYGVEFDVKEDDCMHSLDFYETNRGWNCTIGSLQLYRECSPIEIESLI